MFLIQLPVYTILIFIFSSCAVASASRFKEDDYIYKLDEYPVDAGQNLTIYQKYRFMNDLSLDLPKFDNLQLRNNYPIDRKSKYHRVRLVVKIREEFSPLIDKRLTDLVNYSKEESVVYGFRSDNVNYHLKADNSEEDLYNVFLIKHEDLGKNSIRNFIERLGEKLMYDAVNLVSKKNKNEFGENVKCFIEFLNIPDDDLVLSHTSREDEEPIVILKQISNGNLWYLILRNNSVGSLWVFAKVKREFNS